jgi:hypothetical protein
VREAPPTDNACDGDEEKMTVLRTVAAAAILAASAWTHHAGAAELTGAWSTDGERCNKVFVRTGGKLGFAPDSEMNGSGFIVDGNKLQGVHGSCTIKARKQSGDTLNMIAACATDIMYSDIQFVLKTVDDNTLQRQFPGMDLEVTYHRCQF